MKQLWLFYFVLLAVSAGAQQQIDLYANLSNNQKVVLSEIAKDIRYVPLETTDNCLLSDELQVYDTENCIFVGDQQNSTFFRFSKDGKLLNQIGKKGQGPGEYERVLFFTVDDKARIILQNIYEDSQRLLFFYAYQNAIHYMIYNKQDGKLYNALASGGKDGFTDDLLNGPSFTPFMFARGKGNVVVSIVPSETILEKKSLLLKCPELKVLNADSNPVLGIVTLK